MSYLKTAKLIVWGPERLVSKNMSKNRNVKEQLHGSLYVAMNNAEGLEM
jgi:hypothetical protein